MQDSCRIIYIDPPSWVNLEMPALERRAPSLVPLGRPSETRFFPAQKLKSDRISMRISPAHGSGEPPQDKRVPGRAVRLDPEHHSVLIPQPDLPGDRGGCPRGQGETLET